MAKTFHPWLQHYRALLKPRFFEINGKVFCGADKESYLQRKQEGYSFTTVDENTHNHEHFWCFDNVTLEGFKNNYSLAETVRLVWAEILKLQFPEKEFRLFVSNEYCVSTKNDSTSRDAVIEYHEIVPTLRLWTFDPDFEELHATANLGPRHAWWYSNQDGGAEVSPFLAENLFTLTEARSGDELRVIDVLQHLKT